MGDRLLANMFGGLADFIKSRDVMQEAAKERKRRDEEHSLGMDLSRTQLEGARGANEDAAHIRARRPVVEGYQDYETKTRIFGAQDDASIDEMIRNNPALASQGPALKAAAARGRRLQEQDDATKADQRKAASQQVELGGYQVGEARTQSEALAQVQALRAAGTFDPQKNPAHRDLAALAKQPTLGTPTYQQTLDAEKAADQRRYGYQISAQDHQFNNQVRLADRDLPRGMTAQQKSTMDYLFSELKDQADKAAAELTRINAIITENDTTQRTGQPSYFAQQSSAQGVSGIELDPARAKAANDRMRARQVQLGNNLRLAAAGMMRTLETQGMTHEDAKAVAKQRLDLILSRLPNAQRADGAGGYQDVNPNLPLESELLQTPPSPVRPPPVNPNTPPSGAGYNPGGGGVRLRIKGQQ